MIEIMFDTVAATTPLAWCIEMDGKGYWLPKSRCKMSDQKDNTILVPRWLIIEKELEDYCEENLLEEVE